MKIKFETLDEAIKHAQEFQLGWDDELGVRITLEDDGSFTFFGAGKKVWDSSLEDPYEFKRNNYEATSHQEDELLECFLCEPPVPPSAICKKLDKESAVIRNMIFSLIGKGVLKQTEIYFSWSAEQRLTMQTELSKPAVNLGNFHKSKLTLFDLNLFSFLRRQGTTLFQTDLYSLIIRLETGLLNKIHVSLMSELGKDWWKDGVPIEIRKNCISRFEEDSQIPDHDSIAEREKIYLKYMTFIDIKNILKKNIKALNAIGWFPDRYKQSFKNLESDLQKVNSIRNYVMHPSKQRKFYFDDFRLVKRLIDDFSL